ncbi:MAG TPA: HEAT repeat domain-containing protein [Luteitalea sp.]|nr:HEAT repeat domain-containing protein [Luteitalea sp.]
MLLVSGLLAAALTVIVPAPATAQQPASIESLVKEFHAAQYFWQQLEVAKRLVAAGDRRAVDVFEPYLTHEDRHLRGNAAYVLAGLQDTKGFLVIAGMLTDRAARPVGQGIPGGRLTVDRQIQSDRYYAVHLLGELRDVQAVDVLLPLLGDSQINYKVAWALGRIGDPRAIRPLIAALDDADALVRVSAIQALTELRAAEALPRLQQLLNDNALPNAGDQVPVSQTARAAIAKIQAR